MKISAVIVAYNPIKEKLSNLCNCLISNDIDIIIVDNSVVSILKSLELNPLVSILPLNDNFGIAYAQNLGINHALRNGADILIFFDQDSKIDTDFVPNLLSPIKNTDAIITAPVFFDEKLKFEYPSFRFNKLGLLNKAYCKNQTSPYEVDVIISSGLAATKSVFDKAGLMDEDFFIDFVDIEWAIRCRLNKIPIYIVPQAKMTHTIGEKSINIGIMNGFIHSPNRSYYKLRNPFLLLRKSHVPRIFAIKEIIAAMVHQFVFMFFVKKKWLYTKSYILAIFDGIKGVKGEKK